MDHVTLKIGAMAAENLALPSQDRQQLFKNYYYYYY